MNPTRTGLIDALRRMGAQIELANEREVSGEPVADVTVTHAPLRAIAVDADLALRAIDEIPLLAVAAAFASGTTKIAGVKDLRTKESDRVAAIESLRPAAGIRAASNGTKFAGDRRRQAGRARRRDRRNAPRPSHRDGRCGTRVRVRSSRRRRRREHPGQLSRICERLALAQR